MTVIRPNSISGINSITAQSNALAFYDVAGNKLNIDSDITGGVTVATGATISGSTNTITALTNGSERLRIDSNGFMRHGVISGGTYNGNITFAYNDRYPSIEYRKGGTIDGRLWKDVNNGYFLFENVTNGFIFESSNSEALRISSNGNIGIGTNNPGAKLHVSGGNIKVDDGYGIDFSATGEGSGTMTSELLDDYETGDWTPTIGATTTDPTVSYTTGERRGVYVKVGKKVYLEFWIRLSSCSAQGSGNLRISGLPFTENSNAYTGHGIYFRLDTAGVTLGSGESFVGNIDNAFLYFSKMSNNGVTSNIATGGIPGGVSFAIGCAHYTV